jgi:hypothetical protein
LNQYEQTKDVLSGWFKTAGSKAKKEVAKAEEYASGCFTQGDSMDEEEPRDLLPDHREEKKEEPAPLRRIATAPAYLF